MSVYALGLTFQVFLLAGATFARRPRWSTMLPLTHVLVGLLHRSVAAGGVWVLMEATAVAHVPVPALALAAVAAAVTATLAHRMGVPASTRIVVVGSTRSADALRCELRESRIEHL